jgi:hypothetical protein
MTEFQVFKDTNFSFKRKENGRKVSLERKESTDFISLERKNRFTGLKDGDDAVRILLSNINVGDVFHMEISGPY